jgi:transcriptional regulator with XRE-family HTH domain
LVPVEGYGVTVPDEAGWRRREELRSLLRMCRARNSPHNPGTGTIRQQDAAALAGLSVRSYAALERGTAAHPTVAMIESVAGALNMTAAERSALHVLARGQDPPMPAVPPGDDWAQAGPQLRGAIAGFSGPAAIVDETCTVLAGNTALARFTGGWSEQAPAEERNIILLVFQPQWELLLPEIHDLREVAVAGLRYQYVRNLGSDRFTALVGRLLETGPEARGLWDRYVIGFPRRRYTFRVRDPSGGLSEASYLTGQFTPRIALMLIVLPPDLTSPWT